MVKYALLIGSNYTATPSVQLSGCINDIVNMRNMLIDAYGYEDVNITVLRDDDKTRLPTKANILSSIANNIAKAAATDTLWIHYSGHGTQIRTVDTYESDGLDECIVPCDYNTKGVIDDNTLFNLISIAKCQLILCFDSCHNGTVCDLQYSVNYNNGALNVSANNPKTIADKQIIMLSGSRDSQLSMDAYNNYSKQGVGAFTITLIETLRSYDHNVALLPLYKSLCTNLTKSGFTQIPVLSSSIPNPSYQFTRSNANKNTVFKDAPIISSSLIVTKDLVESMSITNSANSSTFAPTPLSSPVFPKYRFSGKVSSMKRLFTPLDL